MQLRLRRGTFSIFWREFFADSEEANEPDDEKREQSHHDHEAENVAEYRKKRSLAGVVVGSHGFPKHSRASSASAQTSATQRKVARVEAEQHVNASEWSLTGMISEETRATAMVGMGARVQSASLKRMVDRRFAEVDLQRMRPLAFLPARLAHAASPIDVFAMADSHDRDSQLGVAD